MDGRGTKSWWIVYFIRFLIFGVAVENKFGGSWHGQECKSLLSCTAVGHCEWCKCLSAGYKGGIKFHKSECGLVEVERISTNDIEVYQLLSECLVLTMSKYDTQDYGTQLLSKGKQV